MHYEKFKLHNHCQKKEFIELAKHGRTVNTPILVERHKTGKSKKLVTIINTANKASTFSYSPKKAKANVTSKNNSDIKASNITGFKFDYNNPVSESKARNIEFGHGRKKSQEWNDEVAKDLRKELNQRRGNPDWTDRFALK